MKLVDICRCLGVVELKGDFAHHLAANGYLDKDTDEVLLSEGEAASQYKLFRDGLIKRILEEGKRQMKEKGIKSKWD